MLKSAFQSRNVWREDGLAQEETIVSGMAGRYALALYELARERQQTEEVAASLATFSAMIAESPDLQRLVKSPVFSAQEQAAALKSLLNTAGVTGIAADFIRLTAEKRRLFALPDMIAGFNRLNDIAKGVMRAEVTAAAPLDDAAMDKLRGTIAGATASKSVEVAVKVDPSIIGGLVVRLGSRMIDTSLKTKLNLIRTRMKEVG